MQKKINPPGFIKMIHSGKEIKKMVSSSFLLLRATVIPVLVAGVVVVGCKTIPTYRQPISVELPNTFNGQTDSVSMADMPWNDLFTDRYLQSLIDTALQNNWDLKTAYQRIEMARANYQQTVGALRPTVSGVVNAGFDRYSANVDKDVNSLPGNPVTEFFVGLQSTWEIDIWNKLKSRKKAALQRFLSSRKGMNWLKTELVAAVAQRYYDLLTLNQQLNIIRKNIDLQTSAVNVITIQKEGGRATELAVQQFKAQLLNTQSLEADYQQQIIETENELNKLLGRVPEPIRRSDTLVINNAVAAIKTGLPSSLLLRRPDIQQAELEVMAYESDIAAARAAFFPTITLSPYIGVNAFRLATIFDPASIIFGLAGGLTAPLFNRIAIQGNYNRAEAEAKEAFYQYQKTIINAYAEVITNLNRISNFKKIYDLKKQQTQMLEEAVSTSKDLYLASYASYLEVILAQANVLQTELEMVAAKKNINSAFINLYRSLGGGWK